jgi:ribonuclease HI
MKLDELISNRNIKWNKVKRHSDNEGNKRADQLAVSAAKYISFNKYSNNIDYQTQQSNSSFYH